jgi:hypothetical protein
MKCEITSTMNIFLLPIPFKLFEKINRNSTHFIPINISAYNSVEHLHPMRIISFKSVITSSLVSNLIFHILRSKYIVPSITSD